MQTTSINAPKAPIPVGGYVQAKYVRNASDWLLISGQIPVSADGHVPGTIEEQAALVWRNIDAQLHAAGMTKENLVKVTVFLADRTNIDGYRAARDAYLGDHEVALTCIIAGIFDEKWLIEIEAIAAK